MKNHLHAAPSIKEIIAYTVDDIKSIRQIHLEQLEYLHLMQIQYYMTVYYHIFQHQIKLMLLELLQQVLIRSFSGRVGIKTDSIISFSDGSNNLILF